jgi:hypothetical protein
MALVELAVGRIDFAKMNVFLNAGQSETDLLKQYLTKDHRYRNKQITFSPGAMVGGLFVGAKDYHNNDIYRNAVANGSRLFSSVTGAIADGDIFALRRSCALGLQGGEGGINAISSGLHLSADLTAATNEPVVGFYLLKGSWFGDWNLQTNNFLRAVLATPNYGLASMWTVFTDWRLGTLAVGETLGDCLVRTANDTDLTPYALRRSLAVMGDPTLRLNVTAPPSNLVATTNAGNIVLNWNSSPETSPLYHVYRSTNGLDGTFTRLTTNGPTTSATYTDTSPPSGQKTYSVRALNLMITGSGSYTNLSQAIFVTAN